MFSALREHMAAMNVGPSFVKACTKDCQRQDQALPLSTVLAMS